MKKFLIPFVLFFVVACVPEQPADPNIELVRVEYESYFNDFVARDFDAIASHFQVPIMNRGTTPAAVLSTQDEVSAFFSSLTIKFAVPSAVFNATLPVKPSVTITFTFPSIISFPST